MRLTLFLVTICILLGCAPRGSDAPAPPVTAKNAPAGSGGIAPLGSPALGGATPVANSDSVEGAGAGSVGLAAKSQARKAAANASTSATDSATDTDSP